MHNPALGRQVLFIISAMALCVVLPLWLYQATGGANNDRSAWWATSIIVLTGGCYSWVIASARRHLFSMVLWLFTYIFMGMAPYVQYRFSAVPGTVPGADLELFPRAGMIVIVCSLASIIGIILGSRKPARATMRKTYVSRRKANILTLAGIAFFAYFSSKIGPESFLLSRAEFGALRAQVWPNLSQSELLISFLYVFLLVGFLAQMAVRHQEKAASLKAPWLMPLINGLVLLYVINPVSTSRTFVGTVYLAMLAAFGAYATVQRFRIVAGGAVIGMLTLFPLADTFRTSTDATVQAKNVVTELTSPDFDAFAQLATTFDYVAVSGFTYGEQLLGAILFWVPRSVWPTKPVPTGSLLGEHMNYGFVNLSSPIWSELLIDFGWVGTILGMGVIGYVFQRWDLATDLFLRTSRIPPVLVCATAFYLLSVLRGSLLSVASYIPVIVLAAWFVTKTRKDKTSSSPKRATPGGHREPAVRLRTQRLSSPAVRATPGPRAGVALSFVHGKAPRAR